MKRSRNSAHPIQKWLVMKAYSRKWDDKTMLKALRHSSFCMGYHIEKLGLKVGSMLFAGLHGAITVKVLA